MKYVCNPINMEYKYQFIDSEGKRSVSREAADPSMIVFKEKYYLFPSMTAGFLTSENLTEWEFHQLTSLPIYDYAPDVRVVGEYLYFCASNVGTCTYYRTKEPISGDFEAIPGTFPFWDPDLFLDHDGRLYFYWGCSNTTPIYGVELNLEDLKPKSDPVELIFGNIHENGYERTGENHVSVSSDQPYIEGPWMNRHKGRYYLQYASPGTEYNIYSDGVYIADYPLGPFSLAMNNPYSYKPGGFIPGAGHGSTMEDRYGNLWNVSTMRISVNHVFERRIGLWPAGFDSDGELFCNQRYGDWPMKIEQGKIDPWCRPEWMLLSYKKPATASSYEEGKEAAKATDENICTWWRAASSQPGEWLTIDLEKLYKVHAIQINFADDAINPTLPEGKELHGSTILSRYIDERKHETRWILEGSLDGNEYYVIEDKSQTDTDLPHDFIVKEAGIRIRYLRCTVKELPYGQNACISGLRVFGLGEDELPEKAKHVEANILSELDLYVTWEKDDSVGYNVLWGYAPDKLYHSYMVYGSNQVKIGALVKGQPVYVRVDSFNETGITEGDGFGII